MTVAAGDGLQVRFQVSGRVRPALAAKAVEVGYGGAGRGCWRKLRFDGVAEPGGAVGLWAYLSGSATNAPVVLSVDDLDARPV